jgi:hypothetical protein
MKLDSGPLANNAQLHSYLLQIAETLTRLGQTDAARKFVVRPLRPLG